MYLILLLVIIAIITLIFYLVNMFSEDYPLIYAGKNFVHKTSKLSPFLFIINDKKLIRNKENFIGIVSGDDMLYRGINDRTIIICDYNRNMSFRNGDIVVVSNNERMELKEFIKYDSDNIVVGVMDKGEYKVNKNDIVCKVISYVKSL